MENPDAVAKKFRTLKLEILEFKRKYTLNPNQYKSFFYHLQQH